MERRNRAGLGVFRRRPKAFLRRRWRVLIWVIAVASGMALAAQEPPAEPAPGTGVWVQVSGGGSRNRQLDTLLRHEFARYGIPLASHRAGAAHEVQVVAEEFVPPCPGGRKRPGGPPAGTAPPATLTDFVNARAQVRLVLKRIGPDQSLVWAGSVSGSAWCELRELAEARAAQSAAMQLSDVISAGWERTFPESSALQGSRGLPVLVTARGAGEQDGFLRAVVEQGLFEQGVPVTEQPAAAATTLELRVKTRTAPCSLPPPRGSMAVPANSAEIPLLTWPLRAATLTLANRLVTRQGKLAWEWSESTLAACHEAYIRLGQANAALRIADRVARVLAGMR